MFILNPGSRVKKAPDPGYATLLRVLALWMDTHPLSIGGVNIEESHIPSQSRDSS
jgi:hypothetical protein